jgi:uncharacterized membrane protein YccC
MHPLRWIAAAGATARREAAQAARITVCAAVAWQITLWLGASNPPVFAALVPLVALQGDPFAVIGLSLERVAGVVAGIAIGIAAIHLTSRSTATLALTLAAAFAVGMVLRVHGRQNVQVAISALLVLSVPDPGTYGHERLWETGVGAAVAILLGPFLWPPNPLRELERETMLAGRDLLTDLRVTAQLIGMQDANVAASVNVGQVHDHARTARLAATDAPKAARAARFSPLRRSQIPGIEAVGRRADLVARVGFQVERLAQDVESYVRRDDLAEQWTAAAAPVQDLSARAASAAAIAFQDGDPTAAIDDARRSMLEFRDADPGALGVILRRPVSALLDELTRSGPQRPAPDSS